MKIEQEPRRFGLLLLQATQQEQQIDENRRKVSRRIEQACNLQITRYTFAEQSTVPHDKVLYEIDDEHCM